MRKSSEWWLHPHPFRLISYLDDSETHLLGTEGLTNSLSVDPAEETSFEEVQRALFDNQVVASVQKAGGIADVIRDFLAQFAAPLLNYRRLRHLDIPSTLRVME